MRKLINKLLLILITTGISSAFGQIKLKDLNDFQNPKGDWFEASSVKIDSANNNFFSVKQGKGCFVNGTGKTNNFVTKQSFGDIELHVEFLLSKGSNSGIYFQNRYEIQIFDSYGKQNPSYEDCGGIYQRWDVSKPNNLKGYEGVSSLINASLPIGKWQSYDIIFRAPRFDKNGKKIKNAMFEKVILNGKVIHQNKEVTGPTWEGIDGREQALAPLRLQGDHGLVAYRNIFIRNLNNKEEKQTNKWVNLFENTKETGPNYDFIVNGDASNEVANNMFEYVDNELKVMYNWTEKKAPYGMVVTKKVYSSYDLKFEFKWGERRFEPRLDQIRDAGLLYHCQAGSYAWPPSLEYQLQEGDCGDLWTILGCRCDVLKDGEIKKVKIANYSRSEKFTNEEKPGWNSVMVEVRGDKAKYYLNGILINEITNANYGGLTLTSGFIALQGEYSELIYRDIKVREL